MSSVQSKISQIQGVVGDATKHLDIGKEIGHNADTAFFTVSTLKVPLLVELYC